jgi:hypothetical protein
MEPSRLSGWAMWCWHRDESRVVTCLGPITYCLLLTLIAYRLSLIAYCLLPIASLPTALAFTLPSLHPLSP